MILHKFTSDWSFMVKPKKVQVDVHMQDMSKASFLVEKVAKAKLTIRQLSYN